MKRIARRLARALRRHPARHAAPVQPGLPGDSTHGLDWVDACRRSEAFAEDLGELVSRRPAVLAKRELRDLMALR
ncbi:MAG TPA: hypothetical protein PKC59_08485 [Burkholderiaceae bacterium]|nr:hypothetical protein [Burkholderiaceae bacterium]HMX09566.1 hypothetical protein [Burkholderiaceae bacterium]HMY99691.1 hypothetical protein [Burkholderiaceae bacterium]HNG79702.1 hypothetical protein [Burkholderiaceae bacterium]